MFFLLHVTSKTHTITTVCAQVADLSYIKSNGSSGLAYTYDAAVRTKRKLYVCNEFKTTHAELFAIVRCAVIPRSSNWRFLPTWEDFAAALDVADGDHVEQRLKRPLDVIALTVPKTCHELGRKNIFSKASFWEFISKSVACTRRGMCGH